MVTHDIHKITEEETFARWSDAAADESALGRDLDDNGQREPVLVWVKKTADGEKLILVDGYRRYRAAVARGWKVIDCELIHADDENAILGPRLLNKFGVQNIKPSIRALAAYAYRGMILPLAKARQSHNARDKEVIHTDQRLSKWFHVGQSTISKLVAIHKNMNDNLLFAHKCDDIRAGRLTINALHALHCPPKTSRSKPLTTEEFCARAERIALQLNNLCTRELSKPETETLLLRVKEIEDSIALVRKHVVADAEKSDVGIRAETTRREPAAA